MIPAISKHKSDIEALCGRFNVRRLDLFGSAARGNDFTDNSDSDLPVEFETKTNAPALADFLDLRDSLSSLFGRKVDLTMASASNPHLCAAINRSQVPLHGA